MSLSFRPYGFLADEEDGWSVHRAVHRSERKDVPSLLNRT